MISCNVNGTLFWTNERAIIRSLLILRSKRYGSKRNFSPWQLNWPLKMFWAIEGQAVSLLSMAVLVVVVIITLASRHWQYEILLCLRKLPVALMSVLLYWVLHPVLTIPSSFKPLWNSDEASSNLSIPACFKSCDRCTLSLWWILRQQQQSGPKDSAEKREKSELQSIASPVLYACQLMAYALPPTHHSYQTTRSSIPHKSEYQKTTIP